MLQSPDPMQTEGRHRPSVQRLVNVVEAMRGTRLLMLVDLVADRFVTGLARRISREAPVLILELESERLVPGGGANAVANVVELGGLPLPVGVLGDDANGDELLENLLARGVETAGILRRAGHATVTKTRILGGSSQSIRQQIVRIDAGRPLPDDPDLKAQLRGRILELGPTAAGAVLSDYGYGAVTADLLPTVRQALEPGCRIVGDSRYRLRSFDGLDGATPNQEEAEHLLERPLSHPLSSEELQALGPLILERLGGDFQLVTLGSRGMALVERAKGGVRTAWIPVFGTDQVADVTGAGDTVIGTFSLALAAGATPLEASLLANFAAGLVVLKMGTATVTSGELEAAIADGEEVLEGVQWAGS